MKTVLLILFSLHSLIHFAGFAKAFGLLQLKDLQIPVSKPKGLLWLLAGLTFALFTTGMVLNFQPFLFAGIPAVLLSQILLFLHWKDARYGTLLNLLAAAAITVYAGDYFQKKEWSERVKHDFANNNELTTEILGETDLQKLPLPVQQYLRYTRSVGKPKIKNFRATFSGGMRAKPEDEYMQFYSVQYNFFQNPSRYFWMNARQFGLPVSGLHLYQNATSTFRVKLLHLFTVTDAKGAKMNQAETVTLLNDMCLIAPATLTDPRIQWQTIDSTRVKAIFTNQNIRVAAVLTFGRNGALLNFTSNDRYHTDGKKYENYPWSTPVKQYKMLNGYFLPSEALLVYHRRTGDFTYGKMKYESLEYNLNQFMDDSSR